MENVTETAYLRELESSSQCELLFNLSVNLSKLGVLQEEVKAVRRITDSVESLLNHIIKKVEKSIKTLREKQNDTLVENGTKELEVKAMLKNAETQAPVRPTMSLKELIHSKTSNMEFQIFNKRYFVVVNAPFVKEMKLPQVLYTHHMVQLSKFHTLFAESSLNQFTWFKSKDKVNWIEVGNKCRYKPNDEDIGHYLKLICVPCNKVLTGPAAEDISDNKVEEMGELPECPFQKRHEFTRDKMTNNFFRLVCYNVLSNRYADFEYCSPKALAIDYRKQLISKELSGYNGDILCLQEVDSSVYNYYYKEFFKNRNFMSFYHKKGNKMSEGLACFFNKSRFKKLDDHQIIYSNEYQRNRILFNYLKSFIDANKDLKNLFLKQMTSLHITVISVKTPKVIIIVANTHLFYHPEAELVRLLQINIATTYLNSLRMFYAKTYKTASVGVILCGDFNSVPTSAVYEYLTQGTLNRDHRVFKKTMNNPNLRHNFRFESACGRPTYTNYTNDFKGCLDYIFIERDKMDVHNVVPFPTEEELAVYEGLPSDVYPSDHLALVVDLKFK